MVSKVSKVIVLNPKRQTMARPHAASVDIVGLSQPQEDELYDQTEARYGTDMVEAVTGIPYVLNVEGVTLPLLVEHVKRHCERRGHQVHVDE